MKVKILNIFSNIIAAVVLFGAGSLEINNLQFSLPATLCVVAAICTFRSMKSESK